LAHIDKLEIKGIVTSKLERPNSQIYKIYVNKDSKFVSVLTELEEFKVAYIGLLERSKDIINNRKYETGTNISELVSYPIHLFYLVIDLVFIRSMILWPEQVDNNEELLKLYSVSYDKITQIQLSLSEFIKSVEINVAPYEPKREIVKARRGVRPTLGRMDVLHEESLNLDPKIRSAIMDFLGKIIKDLKKSNIFKSDPNSEILIKIMGKY
jgi:hypothetical protein